MKKAAEKVAVTELMKSFRKQLIVVTGGLPFGERRQRLGSNVSQNEISKRSQNVLKYKSTSLSYYLPTESGITMEVCKVMFLRTLGRKSDGMINELLKTKRKSIEGAIAPVKDLRGCKTPPNKVNTDLIVGHISSF